MALIDFTGFENQRADVLPDFFNYSTSALNWCNYFENTRFGVGRCFGIDNVSTGFSANKYFSDSYDVLISGFAFKRYSNFDSATTIRYGSIDGDGQIGARFNPIDGRIAIIIGYSTVVVQSDPNMIDLSNWNFLEFKAKLSNTVGFAEVRVNGVLVLSVYDVDTICLGSSPYITSLTFSSYSAWYLDDFYVCDGTGSENNDFLGNVRVDAIRPSANGNQNDGVASAGSNYECVNEIEPNGDTDYVTLDALNEIELYSLDNLPTTGYTKTIYGIKITYQSRKTDEATRTVAAVLRINGTNYVSSNDTILSTGFTITSKDVWGLNPDDSGVWEEADINALEAGVKVTT